MTRTKEEWEELRERLTALANDPKEPRARRSKAQAILDTMEGPTYVSTTAALRTREGSQRTTASEDTYNPDFDFGPGVEFDYGGIV